MPRWGRMLTTRSRRSRTSALRMAVAEWKTEDVVVLSCVGEPQRTLDSRTWIGPRSVAQSAAG